jgi:hypothetical protein
MKILALLPVVALTVLPSHTSRDSSVAGPSAAEPAEARGGLPAGPRQFDLECFTRGGVVADPNPRSRGTYRANDPTWENHYRMVIDLEAMRYCVVGTCGSIGSVPISAETVDEIILVNEFEGSAAQYDLIRRSDHRFMGRITRPDGFLSSTKGICHLRSFSGLPRAAAPASED